MHKMLICGASGFIGQNLMNYFSKIEEFEVTGIVHTSKISNPLKNQTFIRGDLRDTNFVNEVCKNKDIILQFAATTSGSNDIVNQPHLHVTDNALINSLVLRASHELGIKKLIFPSCTVMYQSSEFSIKENDFDANIDLQKHYFGVGNTKLYIEKMCEFYSRIGNCQHIVLRHSNIYGPFDKFDLSRSHMMGASITKILSSVENDTITVWGSGEERRDLLYVSDFVEAVHSSLGISDKFGIFNVGLGKSESVRNVVEKIIKISGKNLKIEHDLSKPSIPTNIELDFSKFNKSTNWKPKISLDEGIALTCKWWQDAKQNDNLII
ncbi:NAD-dependent epimerase/dehydratase family protein [Alphaproteobacteria bacterium]|nr:NAD-dependent epimerase/dehydratase family protein [Alphaproteobacteria bacterium]